jgi:hypothetical protein
MTDAMLPLDTTADMTHMALSVSKLTHSQDADREQADHEQVDHEQTDSEQADPEQHESEPAEAAAEHHAAAPFAAENASSTSSAPATAKAFGIRLEPQGLTRHLLTVGQLTTEPKRDRILLNITQLFDLATALDDYRAAGLALPNLDQQRWFKRPATWGKVAAGFLVALALTPSLAQLWESPSVVESEVPVNSEAATSLDQQQDTVARIDPETVLEGPAPIDPNALETLPPPPPAGSVNPDAPAPANLPPVTVSPRNAPAQPPPASLPRPVAPPAPSASAQQQAEAPASPESGVALEINPQGEADAPSPADSAAGITSDELAGQGNGDIAAETTELPELAARSQSPSTAPGATAFDTVPQVAEARQYFQNNWTPPESLDQTLEYRLTLAQDGSIQSITPLGQASEIYLDRTNIPLRGEPFVSPVEGSGNPRIRLVLSPDGNVRTFLESN